MPPMNIRKLKKKIRPSHDFSKMVMDYRRKKGYWPKSELDLISTDKKIVNGLYGDGFTDWHLGADTPDSLYIHFIHIPVFHDAHIGGIPIIAREVKIKTLYVHSNGLIKTNLDRKRHRL